MTTELKTEDIVAGTGKAAARGALVTAHYRGWLEDGTEFDSSHQRASCGCRRIWRMASGRWV